MVYTFTRIHAARAFADRAIGAWFVFAAPERGYLVADARAARRLIADGIEPI